MLRSIKKLIGDSQQRKIKSYEKIVSKINQLEQQIELLSDDELRQKTAFFKEQLENGVSLDEIKAEAFAVVREASKRVLGMRHYDSQLIGGLVLSEGNISEMPTGEGKTLVASLPSYLRALEGKGVHVITVNEYLASRDREIIGPVHEFLGLKVGLNVPMLSPAEKMQAYLADITYGVGNEFGFDYLRGNMIYDLNQRVQRPYHFAIIDEIDSVLIDEAKTPLIIAAKTQVSANLYHICAKVARSFKEEEDYMYDPLLKAASLTDNGITKIERAFGVDNLYDLEHHTLYHFMIQALRARVMFKLDVDYIVKDGEIQLVDMFTGRIMEGRTFSEGLHQALEAKEGLEITEENKTQASITIQNYFRMYPNLCGMTGTAKTEEREFRIVYGMDVIQVPTNKPRIREDREDLVFATSDDKYKAVAAEVEERHKKGQPVLIGTTSIIQSETMARYLDDKKIPYELLNAKSVEKEVQLISLAGQKNQVTIATNMAGRGTDIMLGEGVHDLGGLYVIGTERHESKRIDNQLRGRSGRQGDPGESQFFISIEDELLLRFGGEMIDAFKEEMKTTDNGLVQNENINKLVDKIQKMSEDHNYSAREYTLKLDDIINEQREVIYKLRNKLLETDNNFDTIKEMIDTTWKDYVDHYCADELLPEEWNLEELTQRIQLILPTFKGFTQRPEEKKEVQAFITATFEQFMNEVEPLHAQEKICIQTDRILLSNLDTHWTQHLEEMNRLKEGIGLRSYGQEDPMRIYTREGFELFTMMYKTLQRNSSIQYSQMTANYLFATTKED
ncbi:accessory Sec system translocase SecA2 [Alkalihalophilus marmarensis]|uniref:Protein translocase subunit SecA n=1 Tax=Alkalihalophilus marmarensis DSM 21297 TaxID=1188261 RepID=U6SJV6_9BACI|nr:accessory Sec system translocase SecA2 [Alkalihalophilus marmarensis]ERN52004.1 preprotein translocase subunit SecA [Alkalihalophilus marmarensis DSM 21297]